MTEQEPCPVCDTESVKDCKFCNGTGNLGLSLEGAAYTASCSCGYTLSFTQGGYPREEFSILTQKCCPACKGPITAELVGWGTPD